MTHTQYGKSETAGIAALTVVSNYPEKFAIIAGKKDKAQIIMDYAISHIFDNELTKKRFILGEGENLDYIRRHRNKQHLSFDVGNGQLGELFIGSAKDALGFGAPNVIADESAFIEDPEFSLVLRMLAGQQTDLAEATKKIEEFSGSVARRASQQTCSRVEAKPERLQGGRRVINRILLMSRPRNQLLPPVPTWVCPHCGHVHRPADIRRVDADHLRCQSCGQIFLSKPDPQ